MSNKSSTSIINVPKGGGAQKGIGEKFSPDLFTGTGNFTVPIALPPGRNGFQPEINLVYSTGNGNSPFGLGWSLSIPGVSRKTSKGIPRYQDYAPDLEDRDTFILSGAEDLVPLSRATEETSTLYRPRTEGLFARIEHHHDAGNDFWEVRSKDGLVSRYGTSASAGNDPATIADPDLTKRTNVFAWKLSSTEDPFGNRIKYEYFRDMVEETPHHWDQLYLKQIRYVDYPNGSGPARFLVTVDFVYQEYPDPEHPERIDPRDIRPDPFSDYRAGFEIRTQLRCKRIEIRTHADEERLVRTYHLIYLDQRVDETRARLAELEEALRLDPTNADLISQRNVAQAELEQLEAMLPLNGVSLLSQVKVVGHDGDRTEELPPLEFGYSKFEPATREFFPLSGRDFPVQSLSSPDTELVDLFGNGLPDIMQMNGVVRYWRNMGNGQFDLPREMREAPAGLQLADPGVQMIDADGDGRTDLLVTQPGLSGYFPLRFGGLWDRRSFQPYDFAPSFSLEDPEVKLVDLDGDGVTDAIRSGTRLELFFNDPQEGWNDTLRIERRALEVFPDINFSDPRVKWADMSGDGMQDVVLVYDGNVEYWPNLGYGNWGKRIHMQNSPRFPYGYDPRQILVGDVDGDGLADIVYVDHARVLLWINQSGNRWSDPIEIDGTPPFTNIDAVRLVDMLGSGISGVLWGKDAASTRVRENYFFLDFTGGTKPYLLHEMNNHLGAITRVEYAPSTRFYLADEERFATHWKTPLPFPVQVVAKVEVIDEISRGKLTTEYRYHHGYWDGAEREFRGFGRVDQRDTEVFDDFHAPGLHPEKEFEAVDPQMFSKPLETRTWFHQGPVGDEFGEWEEMNYSDEYWAGDPPVLNQKTTTDDFLRTIRERRIKRDALRALRGRILRTELYALDDSARQDRPYTVTESLHGLREENGGGGEEYRVFFSFALAQRTTQWERGDDPMTSFSFTNEYDQYGQSRQQISIAVPRGRDFLVDDASAREPYLATFAETTYAQRDDDLYMVDRVARTTSYEIINDGRSALFSLVEAIKNGTASRSLIGQSINYYDGPAFVGLPFRQIGDFGALVRTETLVLTDDILNEAYKSGDTVLSPPERPPYLVPDASPVWTDEYPEQFRDRMAILAGYNFYDNSVTPEYATGFFVATAHRRYDFHTDAATTRGLLTATRDPFDHETRIAYDAYRLLPTQVTDPANLITHAEYDYRVLQPQLVTDPNDNRSAFSFTPLGLLEATAVMGKVGETVGDTLAEPSTRLQYDFFAFEERGQPISVRTIRRVDHVNDTDASDDTIETIEYSDGFGRLLQTRTQAEDVLFGHVVFGGNILPEDQDDETGTRQDVVGRENLDHTRPNVVVSGWQIYNNKGWVIEKYEPFFSTGWEYAQPTDDELGQKATMFYDPRGQVIRTLNPDESVQIVIYGVPVDLTNPENFTPTPWEAYTYDANDNAGRTHGDAARSYEHHWNTPASVVIDAFGRTVEMIARNGANPVTDWFRTRSTYDIRGNLLTVTDALGRLNFTYVYDLANRPWRIENIDAGIRRMVLDAVGNEIERRDSKGALILQAYDVLNRPIRFWARDQAGEAMTLRQQLEYGDGSDPAQPVAEREANRNLNRLGKLHQHYDEAGRLTFENYDFKGNLLEKFREVISDDEILSVFNSTPIAAYRVNWQPPEGASLPNHADDLLDDKRFQTSTTYDAFNRIKSLRYPEATDEHGVTRRSLLQPTYNRAGALEKVELDSTTYVERIAYNAKGQRTLIAYGNGRMTRYAYDEKTFRLKRLRTEGYTTTALTYTPIDAVLQDFGYEYDLAGNITQIHDRTPESGIPHTPLGVNALDRAFTYDPIYRLLSASGRECDTLPPNPPWDDSFRCDDMTRTRPYDETYTYDAVGNIRQLHHSAGATGTFTRDFTPVPDGNRLQTMTIGATNYTYTYDVNGNLIQENTERHFEWDHSDRMRVFRNQAAGAQPSVYAHYLYDAGGQRVKKFVRKQNGDYDVTHYIDGIFEHHHWEGHETGDNNHLHVMDNQQRIALIQVGDPLPDDPAPEHSIKYHLGDHLGNSNIVVNHSGGWLNREEYTPYGETSFGSFARKRYRYSGKQKDEESGLNYYGRRYYSDYLGLWLTIDPMIYEQKKEGESNIKKLERMLLLYSFSGNNPIKYIDPDGLDFRVTGPRAQEFVEFVSRHSGLDLVLQDDGQVALNPETQDLLPNPYASDTLQNLVSEIINDQNTVVTVNAVERRNAGHIIDSFFGNQAQQLAARSVAVTDLRRLEAHSFNFTSAMIGHFLREYQLAAQNGFINQIPAAATPAQVQSILATFGARFHIPAIEIEARILNDLNQVEREIFGGDRRPWERVIQNQAQQIIAAERIYGPAFRYRILFFPANLGIRGVEGPE